ncbi:MAG: acyl-CoA dehydrogenase [Microgenomates group bacterium]
MPYAAPIADYKFTLDQLISFDQIAATQLFGDATPETVDAVLTEAAKLCENTLAPLNRMGDKHPAKLENGVVRTSPGYAQGYRAIAEGGWIGISSPRAYGGMGLPLVLATCVNDMMGSACLSLQLNPLMTQGQIEALEHHASDAIKALYIPRLISGEWCGTMNLTEPQAGSDVGALRTKAVANGDGTYAVSGQKIYITWADNDFTANVCHLVLARLPGGGEGTRGISLFLVPKFLPNEDGTLGARNALQVVSLEHKLGLHGSPTAVMQYDGATGWLIGAEHKGMAAMFTMMNNARLGVGMQGVSVAEAAFQHALVHANTRKQGQTPQGETAIVDHADVRRMLAEMKAETFAARAIGLSCAAAIDMARATGNPEWLARAALLTPIAKAYGTDTGCDVAQKGIQVHGGMGFIEETGAAQFARDVRVTTIYEGTNGIQAMDLVGRKMADKGDAAFRLIDEMQAYAEAARGKMGALSSDVWNACEAMRKATEHLVAMPVADRFAVAVPYLRAFALVLGAQFHLRSAVVDPARLPLAQFMIRRLLPAHLGLLAQVNEGAKGMDALRAEFVTA